jgi:hypothetical protein
MFILGDTGSVLYTVPSIIYKLVKASDSLTAQTAWGIGFGNPETGLLAKYGPWIFARTNADGGDLSISSGDSGLARIYAHDWIALNNLGSSDSNELRVSCGRPAGINSYSINLVGPDTSMDFDLTAPGRTSANISMRRYWTYIDSVVSVLVQSTRGVFNKARFGIGSDTIHIDSTGITRSGLSQRWNDIADMSLTGIKGTGTAGEPDWVSTGVGISLNSFSVGDSAQGRGEITHEFVEGDSADVHVHYHVNGKDGTARHIAAIVDCDVWNAFGDSVTWHYRDTLFDTIPANTKHMSQRIMSSGKIATPGVQIGAIVYGVPIRIAHGTPPTNDPFFTSVGMHRRIDADGSRGVYTK